MSLEERLQDAGCKLSPADFRDTVQEAFADLAPTWCATFGVDKVSDEELLYHPSYAIVLVSEVRKRAQCKKLPESLILRTLVNCRKSPKAWKASRRTG